jgi:hypothetical protein
MALHCEVVLTSITVGLQVTETEVIVEADDAAVTVTEAAPDLEVS